MRTYFGREINDAVPIMSVMQMYGLKTDMYRLVPCPDKDHNDTHPSAKIYEKTNTCHCFSCQKTLRPIDIVEQQENVMFPQACEILIERFNLDIDSYSEFTLSAKEQEELEKMKEEAKEANDEELLKSIEQAEKKNEDRFPLSPEEVNLIGLHISVQIEEPYFADDYETVKVKTTPFTIYQFYKEDKEAVLSMLKDKAGESLERFLEVAKILREQLSEYPYDSDEKENAYAQKLWDEYINEKKVPPKYCRANDVLFDFARYRRDVQDYTDIEDKISKLEQINTHLKEIYEKFEEQKIEEQEEERDDK